MDMTFDTPGALAVFLIVHLALAAAFWKMAERTREEPKWFALVPVLNLVLFLKLAKRPLWWLLLFLVPLVNVVTMVMAAMSLCERFRLNKWWGLVSIVSPFNLFLYLYLAYGTEDAAAPKPPEPPAAPAVPQA
jgi:hypothetical protein